MVLSYLDRSGHALGRGSPVLSGPWDHVGFRYGRTDCSLMKLALTRVVARRTTRDAAPRWFRVEHRDDLGHHDLGRVPDVFATHHALTPFLAQLVLDGATGEVVLIDEASGIDVARRFLDRSRPLGRTPQTHLVGHAD